MCCVVMYLAHHELESEFVITFTTVVVVIFIIVSDSLHWCLQSYCLDGTEETEEEQLFETWLLLEYCDKGSLQDAVDRGWFHADQNGHIDSRTKPNMRAIRSAGMVCMHSPAGWPLHSLSGMCCVQVGCLKACQATVAWRANQTLQGLSGNC